MLPSEGYGLLPVLDVDPAHLEKFTCGFQNLDEYLSKAHTSHTVRISHTTVVFHSDFTEGPVGYFTLSNDSIKLKTSEMSEFGLDEYNDLASFPAVKIGRFAVSNQLQRQGVGQQLLRFVKGAIFDQNYRTAARVIIVDAANRPEVIRFYERNGFVSSLWAEDQSRNHGRGRANQSPETVKMIKDIMSD